MPRRNSPATEQFWSIPARRLRAELVVAGDTTIARQYGIHRMVVWRLRQKFGVRSPQAVGRPKRKEPRDA